MSGNCYNALLVLGEIDDDEDLVDMGRYASMIIDDKAEGKPATNFQRVRALYLRGRSLMHMDPPATGSSGVVTAAGNSKTGKKATGTGRGTKSLVCNNPADVYFELALKDFRQCLELDVQNKISDLTKIEISKVQKEMKNQHRKRKKKFFAAVAEQRKEMRRKISGKKAFNTHAMKH